MLARFRRSGKGGKQPALSGCCDYHARVAMRIAHCKALDLGRAARTGTRSQEAGGGPSLACSGCRIVTERGDD